MNNSIAQAIALCLGWAIPTLALIYFIKKIQNSSLSFKNKIAMYICILILYFFAILFTGKAISFFLRLFI